MLAKSSVGGSTGAGSMDPVIRGGPWTGSTRWSMDRVHMGGPWTRVRVLYTSTTNIQEGKLVPI